MTIERFLTEARRHGDQGNADVVCVEKRKKKEEEERERMRRSNQD